MGKNPKQERHPVMKSKYFKWGMTAFLVLMASVLSIYLIINLPAIVGGIVDIIGLVVPVVDGIIVAYLLGPLIDFFEEKLIYPIAKKCNIEIDEKRRNLFRAISIFLALTFVFVLIYLFIKMVVPQLIASIQNIIVQMPVYLESLINIADSIIEKLGLFPEQDVQAVIEHYYEDIMLFVQENIVPNINSWVKSLSSSVFGFFGALWDLLVGFIISVYLLAGKERFRAQIKKLIYAFFKRERANRIIEDIRYVDKTFISFFAGKIIDSIIIGMLCFIILTLFNMPYASLISVIIGVTNVIPFFGPFIGAIPSAILILLIEPRKALYFVIIVIILQQFDGNILGPIILGNSTGLSGFWVISSITLFGGFWGIPGVFLGVPTFACFYAWLRRLVRGLLYEKRLSSNTDDYLNLDYIDKNNNICDKNAKRKLKLGEEKKYTILDIDEEKTNNDESILSIDSLKTIIGNIKRKKESVYESEDEIINDEIINTDNNKRFEDNVKDNNNAADDENSDF